MALKRWVIQLAPAFTAFSPVEMEAEECPEIFLY